MYNCSLYFPQTSLFTQPPSVFLKCENIDEEQLIAEAEAVLDRNEALIKSNVRPLPPVRKPWSFAKKALLTVLTASGTFITYKLVVKAPAYEGPEVDLREKVIVVTEATSRMSRNLVQELARRKATLVLTSRSMDDCEDTRSRLMRWVPGTEEVHIDCRRLDLDSSRSIRRFAGALIKDYPRGIDRLLIHPPGLLSGVIAGDRRLTHDAFEHQLGTSFFSFYLLTRLLLPSMSGRDRDARVVFTVDTRAAGFAEAVAEKDPITNAVHLPIDNWNWGEGYSPSAGYQRAQWALRLFADELAKRTAETGPTVVIADPLVNRTSPPPKLSDEANWIAPLRWLRNIGRSYLNLGRLITRIAPQRVTATEVMCAVATRESLGLLEGATTEAPVFQKLKRKEPPNNDVDRSQARDLIWKLGEKWTHLDTHPDPVPLPPRF